jgi:hypothetical protein
VKRSWDLELRRCERHFDGARTDADDPTRSVELPSTGLPCAVRLPSEWRV